MLDNAVPAEELGFDGFGVGERHERPFISSSPTVVLSHIAALTRRIRLFTAVTTLSLLDPVRAYEDYATLDHLSEGRLDLITGKGNGAAQRELFQVTPEDQWDRNAESYEVFRKIWRQDKVTGRPPAEKPTGSSEVEGRVPNGLLIPPRFSFARLLGSPRIALQRKLLLLPGAESQEYAEQIDDILALLAGTYRSPEGIEAHVVPGEGADVELWILGSSGGTSAGTAGARGLRFAANYHVSPATVLEAVDGYRSFFEPSDILDKPYVSVSADVVVAEDDETARELATGYGPWVRSIRTAEGAIQFPTPDEARAHAWTDEDRELVQDRVDTQFGGSPATVADRLEQLQEATDADELLITTITHGHAGRVRSYELLAEEWRKRGHSAQSS
ncbi:LLM class flavin-dependent oxidoreductase [Streptomyces sp. WM6386]|uniref:LLM class flavin-dependent oxidoreductase n=1 Tax=Streptomyces sp. WM6386 TaxID=1415558 RepID=UPI000AF019B2|nr:LLM class flavin-dependent oxidoreductase [Streptomyces sp. WM6386]